MFRTCLAGVELAGSAPFVDLRLPAFIHFRAILETFMNIVIRESGERAAIASTQSAAGIEPPAKVAYSLQELVAGISPRNMHGEVHFGAPAGKEVF